MLEKQRDKLAEYGVRNSHATVILWAMCEEGVTFGEALRAWADFKGYAPEPLRSHIAYYMLGAGVETPPEKWFNKLRKEIEREDEDRLLTEEGD